MRYDARFSSALDLMIRKAAPLRIIALTGGSASISARGVTPTNIGVSLSFRSSGAPITQLPQRSHSVIVASEGASRD